MHVITNDYHRLAGLASALPHYFNNGNEIH
uniref:Uncharacterized protein n=1 Tax=Anguilla anguilla TaxID=7936 RepID=A0A0E9VGD9_ANGAN